MKKTLTSFLSIFSLQSALFAATLGTNVTNTSLVIYNTNLALVHEERTLSIQKNDTKIFYEGVAKSIITDSVNVTLNPLISLKSQQFKFDTLSLNKLLDAYIGQKVELRLLKNANEFKIITATLLAHNAKESLLQTLDYKIITAQNHDIMFDTIPKKLITKPSLVWNVSVKQDLSDTMKLDYLIRNISFKSNYILNVDKNSSHLTGWMTINNKSGKTFTKTKLSLLAGDINTVVTNTPYRAKVLMAMSEPVQAKHSAYEGYHLYEIPFQVTLANNEKTQLKFINKKEIPTTKIYSAYLRNPLYLRGQISSNVNQYIVLQGINVPLPQGTIRTYSKRSGQTIFLGENHIPHTPKKTPVQLKIGKNFDIKVTQTERHRQDTKKQFDVTVHYTITNRSTTDKTVTLLIPFHRSKDFQITTDKKYSFTKGNLLTFDINVKADATENFEVHFQAQKN